MAYHSNEMNLCRHPGKIIVNRRDMVQKHIRITIHLIVYVFCLGFQGMWSFTDVVIVLVNVVMNVMKVLVNVEMMTVNL